MLLPYPYEHSLGSPPVWEAPSLSFALHTCKHEALSAVRGSMSACHFPSHANASAWVAEGTADSVPQSEKGGLASRE